MYQGQQVQKDKTPSLISDRKRAVVFCLLAVSITIFLLFYFQFFNRDELAQKRRFLENSEQFTLYSLRDGNENVSVAPAPDKIFHRYEILGKMLVTDPKIKAQLIQSLYYGMEHRNGFAAACFNPRHGIRATKGKRTVDVVICFECSQIDFWESNQRQHTYTSRTPQKVFDKVLKKGGVSLGRRLF